MITFVFRKNNRTIKIMDMMSEHKPQYLNNTHNTQKSELSL